MHDCSSDHRLLFSAVQCGIIICFYWDRERKYNLAVVYYMYRHSLYVGIISDLSFEDFSPLRLSTSEKYAKEGKTHVFGRGHHSNLTDSRMSLLYLLGNPRVMWSSV